MGFYDILYIFFVLAVLAGVMYSMLYFVKKLMYNQAGKFNNSLGIKVLSTQIIMPKKYISIIKIHEKYFVIGISDNSINLIDKLDQFEEQAFPSSTNQKTFMDYLKQNLNLK